MSFNYGSARMEKMISIYPFLAPFDREPSKALISDLEKEIAKLTKMVSNLKKAKDSYDDKGKLLPQIKKQVKYLNAKKNILIEYMSYVKKKFSYMHTQKKEENVSLVKVALSDKQCILLEHIVTHGLSPEIKVKDLSDIYLYLLDRLDDFDLLNDIAIHLVDLANNSDGDLGDYLCLLVNKLREKTSKKIRELEKGSKDRNRLKQVIKVFKIENEPVEEEKHDYRFDIVDFWLNDGNSYIYLKRLVELMPTIVNLKNNNGEHIIYTILDYYFDSCRTELRNQTKDYISKEYYAEIFNLFYNNPLLKLDNPELLFSKIEEFKNEIKKYKKSPIVLSSIEKLGRKEEDKKEIEKVDCEYLGYAYNLAIRKSNKRDLTDEYTFAVIGDNNSYINRCYSVKEGKDGSFILKIHTVDMTEYVDKDTDLDRYLKSHMFKTDEPLLPDDVITNYLSFAKGIKRPTITYEVRISSSGRIIGYDMYKSIVSLDDKFTYNNFTFPNETIKNSYFSMLDNSIVDRTDIGANLEKMFLSRVSKVVGTHFNKRNLPCIYRVQKEQQNDEFVKNMNALNGFMARISKKDATIIYGIICEDHNTSFYDQVNIGHAGSNQPYYLDLFNPFDSYITLTLQRLVDDFCIRGNEYRVESWQDELVDIINRANTIKAKNKEQSKRKTLE